MTTIEEAVKKAVGTPSKTPIDQLKEFMESNTAHQMGSQILRKELYALFIKNYASVAIRGNWTGQIGFNRELTRLGYQSHRTGRGMVWSDLKLMGDAKL